MLYQAWEGYAEPLEELRQKMVAADGFFSNQEYGYASEYFNAVTEQCDLLIAREDLRLSAEREQGKARKQRQEAVSANAEELKLSEWETAHALLQDARDQYENFHFLKASNLWNQAVYQLTQAAQHAAFKKAHSGWNARTEGVLEDIPGFGPLTARYVIENAPAQWAEAHDLIDSVEEPKDDYPAATQAYVKALRLFNQAVEEIMEGLSEPTVTKIQCNQTRFEVEANGESIDVENGAVKLAPFVPHQLRFSATGCETVVVDLEARLPGEVFELPIVRLPPLGGDPTAVRSVERNARWVKNEYADGSVTMSDRQTGLMWVHNASTNGLRNWRNASKRCEQIAYAGYDDWRLPSVQELEPMFNEKELFDGVKTSWVSGMYWTDTAGKKRRSAMVLDMRNGNVFDRPKETQNFVWPVRSRIPEPERASRTGKL